MIRKQQQCRYCHNEIGRPHYALLDSHFYTSDDELMEATVDINSNDKTMSLIVGDYYGDDTDQIKINYCPKCGRKL